MSYNDEVVTSNHWNPTEEQFAAYKKREVELAVKNLRGLAKPDFATTLHSFDTLASALRVINGK